MNTICVYGTKNYLHAFRNCIRRLITAARHHTSICLIYAGDTSKECQEAYEFIKQEIPDRWTSHFISLDIPDDSSEKYKVEAQIRIARLQGMSFSQARKLNPDWCWSVESDVLVPPDSLRIMEWAISMPKANGESYYDVAMCTYPNGMFLGGRGTPHHPIIEDFIPKERRLSDPLKKEHDSHIRKLKGFQNRKEQPDPDFNKEAETLNKKIRECSPDGNIFQVIAKHGWRKRGWLDHAYPAIGRGAILPTDWVGLGCTLMSKKALHLATFEGYDGCGTQDLFLTWKKWYPEGIKMTVVTHSICDHVKPDRNDPSKIVHYRAYHEAVGECEGHLRCESKPWIPLDEA